MIYKPDGHVFLKIVLTNQTYYKVMGSWDGVFDQAWRMNSGIERVTEDNGILSIHGFSGSIYEVPKEGRGLNLYARGVLQEAMKGNEVTVISTEELLEALNEKS